MLLQSNQLKFIYSPISTILREAIVASSSIGEGIETYSVNEYILHSVFLKMTGAQEQKMKCIVWELASGDYEYRYFRYTQKPYGECSCFDEKNRIYRDLIDQIVKRENTFNVSTYLNKIDILNHVKTEIDDIFNTSSLKKTQPRLYHEYLEMISFVKAECIVAGDVSANKKNDERKILSKCDKCKYNSTKGGIIPCPTNKKNLFDVYELLYRHRNRCAHNTASYQRNLPTLSTLANSNYRYENYFLYFAILILIDDVFIKLFDKYKKIIEMVII